MRFSTSPKAIKKLAGIAAALMILPVAVACDTTQVADDVAVDPATEEVPATADLAVTEGETIVDVAMSNGSFDTLVSAVQAADLADTLSAEGPYTVFAPTDDAFAAIPEDKLNALLLPENQETLQQILTYHVVSGEVPSSEISAGAVPTVEGGEVTISVDGGTVMVNDATVVQPDVMASNGVIHVIDAVLLPPTVSLDDL